MRWRELRTLRAAFFKHGLDVSAPVPGVSPEVHAWARDRFDFGGLNEVCAQDSREDGATKLLFALPTGQTFESVILRYPHGRTTLCVSSQVGCALRCRFCATGLIPEVVDLTAEQILEQVVATRRRLQPEGRTLRNVVFMGMGEPLQNEATLHSALEALTDGERFNIPPRSILVSSAGIPDAMLRLHERFPRVRLALSLHAALPEVRERLMPITRKHSLAALRAVLERVTEESSVMLEVLLLDGVNDREVDLEALVDFCRDLSVHVNLIPFNPIVPTRDSSRSGLRNGVDLALRPSDDARFRHFRAALEAAGIPVTRRYSLGRDIDAACGQLARSKRGD